MNGGHRNLNPGGALALLPHQMCLCLKSLLDLTYCPGIPYADRMRNVCIFLVIRVRNFSTMTCSKVDMCST